MLKWKFFIERYVKGPENEDDDGEGIDEDHFGEFEEL